MCCDASVIPNHISSNPNSMIMALPAGSDYVNAEILGAKSASTAEAGIWRAVAGDSTAMTDPSRL